MTTDRSHSLRTGLLTAVRHAPFGDAPDSSSPPFSVNQLTGFLATNSADTMPEKKLQRLCLHTLRDLEARSRKGIERKLHALAESDGAELPSPPAWRGLPPSLRAVLWLRHGPESQTRALAELEPPAHDASVEEAVAAFRPLARIAERLVAWHIVLGAPLEPAAEEEERRFGSHDGSSSPDGVLPPARSWPDAEAWQRLRDDSVVRARAAANNMRNMPPPPTLCAVEPGRTVGIQGGLAVTVTIDERAQPSPYHWEVRVRVECLGEAKSISRITLVEDLQKCWPEAMGNLTQADAERLRKIATRDVHVTPPALLHGPGCFAEMALKLPRVPPEAEKPPIVCVAEVIP